MLFFLQNSQLSFQLSVVCWITETLSPFNHFILLHKNSLPTQPLDKRRQHQSLKLYEVHEVMRTKDVENIEQI